MNNIQEFEWDRRKQELNIEKHSLDFVDAVQVFLDPFRVETETMPRVERRYQVTGILNGIIIFLVYTRRGNKIRIISARRASKNERKVYYDSREETSEGAY